MNTKRDAGWQTTWLDIERSTLKELHERARLSGRDFDEVVNDALRESNAHDALVTERDTLVTALRGIMRSTDLFDGDGDEALGALDTIRYIAEDALAAATKGE